MIQPLIVTILIESLVIIGYAQWYKKPLLWLLVSGTLANLLTQTLLWIALWASPLAYLPTLFGMEILILGLEFVIFYFNRNNRLKWDEALLLTGVMNFASFSIGLLLRI